MFDDTPLLMVDTDDGVRKLAERLSRAKVIGVDTESDSMYHYQEKVCLLQFTDSHGDIILDPLAVTSLEPLADVMADPTIVKVLHGADYDVVCLRRDFDFQIRNLFDTLVAAQFAGLDRLGLADLIDRHFGEPIDKQYQRHDWSKRPLLPEHLDYARGDTHFLLALREILLRRLADVNRIPHFLEECALLEEKEWQGRSFDPDGYLNVKGARGLSDEQWRVLRRLYLYRDEQARKADRPPYKVVGDRLLVQIAKGRPTSRADLDKMFQRKQGLKRRYGSGLIKAVQQGLEDDFEIPKPERNKPKKPKGPRPRLRGRAADRVQEGLKTWRNRLIKTSPLYSPFTVASNADLQTIARARPLDLDELAALDGIRSWQVRDFGETILEILEEEAPADRIGQDDDDEDDDEDTGRSKRRRRRRR